MTKNKKILLGILTFLPYVFIAIYFFAFFISFSGIFIASHNNYEPNPDILFGNFALVFIIIMLASLLSIGLMIYYIIHIANNPKFDETNRLIWILIIIFANLIGYSIYWYLQIWKVDNGVPLKQ